MKYEVVTKTPTPTLIDRILQRYAGQTANITIAYMRIKTSTGVVLGQASLTYSDWSNHKATKTITITTGGTASYFSLDASDGTELYKYTLSTPFTVSENDTVTISWTIGVQTTTTVTQVQKLLETIEGYTYDLKIARIYFVSQNSIKDTVTNPSVTPDTTNDKLVISVTLTPSESYTYDKVWLSATDGSLLLELSVSATVSYGTTVSITFNVSITT